MPETVRHDGTRAHPARASSDLDPAADRSAAGAVGPGSWLPAAAALAMAGWGVNQFTPLSVAYRAHEHWPAVEVALMFTTYLVGLVPALLWGGAAADRYGRHIVRPALGLAALASAALALGELSPAAVFASRLVSGIAAGIILSAGTAWVLELSARAGRPELGARRVAYATGGGFAVGALVSGCIVQWLPHPLQLAGPVHAAVALLVLVATDRVPETAGGGRCPVPAGDRLRAALRGSTRHPRFVLVVLPASPAVFAAATVAYVVLPPLVADRVTGYEALFSGLVTALTLVVGLAVQPLAARLDHAGSARATLAAMATVIAGLLVGALAVYRDSALLVLVAATCLGAGYGLTLASGLREIERLTPPAELPSATSLYQGAAHGGLLTPLLLAVTAGAAPYPALLVTLAAIGALFLVLTARYSRRHLPG